jgi:predicted kinase
LTAEEVREIARDYVTMELARTLPQDRPRALLLAGQSGAGKSTLSDALADDLIGEGGFVTVSPDVMRQRLPYLDELDTSSPDFIPATEEDARALTHAVREEAMAHRRNIVIDGTLRKPEVALDLATTLRAAGYRTELHALAVNDQVSYQRAAARYERERSSGGFARWTVREMHDRSYHAVADSVRRLEYTGAVDRVAVYNRLGDAIHDRTPVKGEARAAGLLEKAREQLTTYERVSLAHNWDDIVESMDRRNASSDERLLVLAGQERAHYSLRTSPEASEQFDAQYPYDTANSRERALAYGARLAAAYKAGKPGDYMSELAVAYQVKRAAMEQHFDNRSDEAVRRLSSQIDRQILDCLLQAKTPTFDVRPHVQQEFDALKKEVNDILESFRLVEASGMSLDEQDRRELRDAQKRLGDFIEQHAGQLTRDLSSVPGHSDRARDTLPAASASPRPI